MNHDSFIPKRRISILILSMSCIFFIAACSFQPTLEFPDIVYTSNSAVPTKVPDQTESASIATGTIKIAVPVSAECLRYLSLMYIGESSGLFKDIDSFSNGLTVSLDALENFDAGLNVVLQPVPSTGYSQQEMDILTSSNSLPDILFFNSSNRLSVYNFRPVIFEESIISDYFSPSIVFPAMIQNGLTSSRIQSLPYYASIKMLFADADVLVDATKVSLLPDSGPLDYTAIKTIAKKVTKADAGIYGFMGLSDLLAFFPMVLGISSNSYMWNGAQFHFESPHFIQGVDEIKSLIAGGSVLDSLTSSQKKAKYGDSDPRSLDKIGFWVDDSNRLESWKTLGVENVRRYPFQGDKKIAVPLSVYSIAVNANASLLQDAQKLAAYIALDKDALLFRSRYPIANGFIPPIRDKEVWESLVKPQLQGNELFSLYDKMDSAKSVTNLEENFIKGIYDSLYTNYFNDILYSRKSLATFVEEINTSANQAILNH